MKTDAETPAAPSPARFPRSAVWIHANDNFTDSVNVSACDVLEMSGDGTTARIRVRGGCAAREMWVAVATLASDADKALAKLPALVSDLFTRPPSITLAGKKAGRPETPSFLTPSLTGGEAVTANQTICDPKGSQ
ncbi:hypothetical protein OpiT1DRAFT_04737 [Opitutaceae bacterium TAV1]|nr:hypothetical protein OpiT1DRAFT_04737 [Opitutaceae bacterium TAV1]